MECAARGGDSEKHDERAGYKVRGWNYRQPGAMPVLRERDAFHCSRLKPIHRVRGRGRNRQGKRKDGQTGHGNRARTESSGSGNDAGNHGPCEYDRTEGANPKGAQEFKKKSSNYVAKTFGETPQWNLKFEIQ